MMDFRPLGFDWAEKWKRHGELRFSFPDDAAVLTVSGSSPHASVEMCLPRRGDAPSSSVRWDSRLPEWLYLASLADRLCAEESQWKVDRLFGLDEDVLETEGYLEPSGTVTRPFAEIAQARHRKAWDHLMEVTGCPVTASLLVCMVESDLFGLGGYPRAGEVSVYQGGARICTLATELREPAGPVGREDLWAAARVLERGRKVLSSTRSLLTDLGEWETWASDLVRGKRGAARRMREYLEYGRRR